MKGPMRLFFFILSLIVGIAASGAQTMPQRMTPGELAAQLRIVASELRNLDGPVNNLNSKFGPPDAAKDDHKFLMVTADTSDAIATEWEKTPTVAIKNFNLFFVFSSLDEILLQAAESRGLASLSENRPNSLANEIRAIDASTTRLRRSRSRLANELEIRLADSPSQSK